jgi:hypothetical protein
MINRRQALASGAAATLVATAAAAAEPADAFIGPLPGWRNVRTDFGGAGDGRADDTAALQRALDALVGSGSLSLYIPAGRYRITRTLMLPRRAAREAKGLNIQGEDPARTAIVWDGPRDGRMVEYGAWYSKLGRLTFDGAGKAGVGLAHGPQFVTANEIADCVFQDLDVGIEAGTPEHAGIAETSVIRCRFLRCSAAGASLRNFNSLDWWFHRCRFEACQIGLTNVYGAGNFHAYDSVFLGSREADIEIGNTGFFGFRGNLSIGSKAFFVARFTGAAAHATLQANRIFDTADVAAVRVANQGPLILLDNLIVSRPGQAGPAVEARGAIGVAVGNRFSAAADVALTPGSVVLDNTRVARSTPPAPPPAPVAPPPYRGPVSTIRPGAGAAAVQSAIDSAARHGGGVIYFAPGAHPIERTLVIPTGADVRLVGDGLVGGARLEWSGPGEGPIVRLDGAGSQIRDLGLSGGARADAVELRGCDQSPAVLLDQLKLHGNGEVGLQADGLARAVLVLRDMDHAENRLGLRLVGRGPGRSAPMLIASGSSSDNDLSYELSAGARLVARDIWYESASKPAFMRLSGAAEFTLNGANIATPRRADAPAVTVEGLEGTATFLGVIFTGAPEPLPAIVASGAEPAQALLLLGTQGNGEYFADRSRSGRALRLASLVYTSGGGAKAIPDQGSADPAFLRRMLAGARMQEPRDLGPPRLYRVYVDRSRVGVRLMA